MSQLDQQRERIQDDLRGLVRGDILCDPIHVQLHATDASVYEIRPLGVVRPRSTADVAACVKYAAEIHVPVHARGAGTGLAGAALGAGLVIDFSRYMRRVLRVDEESVRVQPGVVHERLNAQLRTRSRTLGVDPSTSSVTTVGGMIGIDAKGSRWLQYGSIREHVRGLQAVLADGSVVELGQEPIVASPGRYPDPRKRDLVARLAALLSRHADVISRHRPQGSVQPPGFRLDDVLSPTHVDLARMLPGSEGTLALVTEATLATQPLPRARGVALLLFESLERASHAILDILPHRPSACDLMDRRHVSLVRETEVDFDLLIPRETEAVLLVEFLGDDPIEVRGCLQSLIDEVRYEKRLAFGARQALDAVETDLYWRLASRAQPAFYRVKGPSRPVPVVDDMAVPPERLPDFLVRTQNVLKRHQVTASIFCHGGHGQFHLQPFLDLNQPDDVERMRRMAEDLYNEVLELGGCIGGEHACGLARTAFLPRQFGPLYPVMREVKRTFDPDNLLNPGKLIGDDPDLLTHNLRNGVQITASETPPETVREGEPQLRRLVELQLDWAPERIAPAVDACNGCGLCRSQASELRMCPAFRFASTEEAAPRAKANLLRGVLSGKLELSALTSLEFKQIADLCIHCHMCRLECPAEVDIPAMMREAKGAYVAANGLYLHDWFMTRIDWVLAVASHFRSLANWAIGNRQMRWMIEKALGIAQGRKLPRLAPRSFLHRAAKRKWTRPPRRSGHKALLFVDLYANYCDPELAEATVAVLEHNGVDVYVHPDQKQAGMPALTAGSLEFARRLARHNVALLADAVRQGYEVVAIEPSAALCLVREYPQMLADEDAELVARSTSEVCTYLWRMHTRGKLQLDFKPVHASLGYHAPCHLKALRVGLPGLNLLGLVPGLRVLPVEAGCSGMGGTFGLQRKNYRSSLRAGWRLIARLRDPIVQAGTTECSACKIQMEQGTTKPTIHPIKLLALSYGLMPELSHALTAPCEELIVS